MANLASGGGGYTMVGVSDSRVSTYNKARILQGDVMVTGVIGEGASKDLVVNWNSPFEEDTAGGHFQKIGGLVQSAHLTEPVKAKCPPCRYGRATVRTRSTCRFYSMH